MASASDTDSTFFNGQESDTIPTSAPRSIPIPDDPILETRLFAKFPGYLHSQRLRPPKGWSWHFSYDITKGNTRLWACKACLQRNSPTISNFSHRSTQNHIRHLYEVHSISAPDGRTKSLSQKKAEPHASSRELSQSPDITSYFGLNPENPREQAIANTFIKSFDTQEFRRLLLDWVIGWNHPFRIVEE